MRISKQQIGLIRQLTAGSAASLGVLSCAVVYAWVTQILPSLLEPNSPIPMTEEQAGWMVTMPEFGNLISPLPAAYAADRFGRKVVILASAPIFLTGWIIILYFESLLALNIARVIQGLSVGIVYTVIPIYLGEIASPKYRGTIISIFFCLWWFGFLFEYLIGDFLSYVNYTYVAAFTNIVFLIVFLWQPESPYYFTMIGDIIKAKTSLTWFSNKTKQEIETELDSIKRCVEEDQKNSRGWRDLIATPVERKALAILFFVGYLRIYSGLISLSLYSTQTLEETKVKFFISPDDVTTVMGVMMVVGSLFSSFTLDTFGRQPLLFFSCFVSGVFMFLTGIFYLLQVYSTVDLSHYTWVPPVSLIALSGVSVIGIFPVNVAYMSELFASNMRGTASGVFSIYTTVIGFFALKLYLTIFYHLGAHVNFFIFAFTCFLGALMSFSAMPETKGKSFERIRFELKNKNVRCDTEMTAGHDSNVGLHL